MQANSLIDVISFLANMAGPVIGGILFSVVGLVPILYVSTGCFLLSAIMEIFIHIPFEKKQAGGNVYVSETACTVKDFVRIRVAEPVPVFSGVDWSPGYHYTASGIFHKYR